MLDGNWGRDRAGWILLGESSTTAAPILETVGVCLETWGSAEVGDSVLDIQVKPALGWGGQGPSCSAILKFLVRLLGSGPLWGASSRETMQNRGVGILGGFFDFFWIFWISSFGAPFGVGTPLGSSISRNHAGWRDRRPNPRHFVQKSGDLGFGGCQMGGQGKGG